VTSPPPGDPPLKRYLAIGGAVLAIIGGIWEASGVWYGLLDEVRSNSVRLIRCEKHLDAPHYSDADAMQNERLKALEVRFDAIELRPRMSERLRGLP